MLDRQLRGQCDVFVVCLCVLQIDKQYSYCTCSSPTTYQTIKSIRTVFANKIVIYLYMHTIYTNLLHLIDMFFFKGSDIKPLMDFTNKRRTKDCSELTLE